MEGSIGPVGPFANPVVAILVVLILPAILGLAVYRGEQAYRNRKEAVIRARARWAYLCFLVWGAFLIVFVSVALLTAGLPFGERQAAVSLVGIFGGPPAAFVAAIGLFHGLMCWRMPLVRLILLVTVALLPLIFSDYFREPWSSMIATGYSLLVIGASIRGLRGLRMAAS